MKFYLTILLFITITCNQNNYDKKESIYSDIISGTLNGLSNDPDKSVELLKHLTEYGVRSNELTSKACELYSKYLKQSMETGLLDKMQFLKKINSPNFVKESIEFVKNDPISNLSWKIDRVGFSKISQFVEKTAPKLIKVFPFVTAAFCTYEAYNKVSEGDYIGAGLKVAVGAVSFIPGLTFVQSITPSVLSFAYDLTK